MWRSAISGVVAGLALTTAVSAGPADRVLRACAPGTAGDPVATLLAEGWQELGVPQATQIEARIGLLSDVGQAADVRFPLDNLRTDGGRREERGRKAIARAAEGAKTVYLSPRDGTSMAQITTVTTPRPSLYCMVSTVANREAHDIARRLIAMTEPRMVEGYGGILSAKSLREPPDDPVTDVSATPLPKQWRVLAVDLTLNGDLADTDLFIEAYWTDLQ